MADKEPDDIKTKKYVGSYCRKTPEEERKWNKEMQRARNKKRWYASLDKGQNKLIHRLRVNHFFWSPLNK